MALAQKKLFAAPVLKKNGTYALIQVGDPMDVVQKDKTIVTVTVTSVAKKNRLIGWSCTGVPRSEDVVAVNGNHLKPATTTTDLHTGAYGEDKLLPVVNSAG